MGKWEKNDYVLSVLKNLSRPSTRTYSPAPIVETRFISIIAGDAVLK